jgi:hypothetical protein
VLPRVGSPLDELAEEREHMAEARFLVHEVRLRDGGTEATRTWLMNAAARCDDLTGGLSGRSIAPAAVRRCAVPVIAATGQLSGVTRSADWPALAGGFRWCGGGPGRTAHARAAARTRSRTYRSSGILPSRRATPSEQPANPVGPGPALPDGCGLATVERLAA